MPPTPNCGSPAPDPVVRLHHDVTSTTPGGFTAVLTIHNLQGQDTPILDWSVPLRLDGRRVLWVAGARLVQDGTVPRLTGIPGGPTVAIPGNTTLTISLGLSGSPIGSQHIFGSVPGVPTGWE